MHLHRSTLARFLGVLLLSSSAVLASAADPPPRLSDYLPAGVTYDPEVPKPRTVLGFEVGEWHVRHDLLVQYCWALAGESDRVLIEEYGRTHEARPLLLLTISHPDNLSRIEEIRARHRSRALGDEVAGGTEADPAVVWLGYSVHGNEPSGSNAAPVVAYHLAAAQGEEIESLLRRTVIILDPCLNPDGLSRFAHWANSHRGAKLVSDPAHREHREAWPGGRTNHYWFDLNRDWLLLTHPESRGRVQRFQDWLPNLLTDFHEMGTNSTYFFQPGVPSRQNPNTPRRSLELTRKIARFHADILDREGRLYYSEEQFDDFYYGKGSTYPDVHGGIGILFEQASSRGHLQESVNGPLSFPTTIRNQFLTTLSSLQGAAAHREELLRYQRDFFRTALAEAEKGRARGYVFAEPTDGGRLHHFVDILRRHRIRVHRLAIPVTVAGRSYDPGSAYFVPARQPQYRLITALFERRREFGDAVFYDVSSWTLPDSCGVPYAEVRYSDSEGELAGEEIEGVPMPRHSLASDEVPYAYLFEWNEYYAPRALARLLAAGAKARVATRPFEVATARHERRRFSPGTIIIPRGLQDEEVEPLPPVMQRILTEDGVEIFAVPSGLTARGIDLGSPSVAAIEEPKPLLLVGSGVSAYEAGEVWHLLDQRCHLPLSMVELRSFDSLDLERYTHLILVSGRYGSLNDAAVQKIQDWVRAGGVVLAQRGAATWAERRILGRKPPEPPRPDPDEEIAVGPRVRYQDYEKQRAQKRVSGAIFEIELDLGHPIAFGYPRPRLPVFKNSSRALDPDPDPYARLGAYSRSPVLAGFVDEEIRERLAGKPAIAASRYGRGAVIRYADNPNFRGVWYGTNKLFLNGIFFGRTIKPTGPITAESEADSLEDDDDDHDH